MSAKRARKPKLYLIESFTKRETTGVARVHHVASMTRAQAVESVLKACGENTIITLVNLIGGRTTVSIKYWKPMP